MLNIIISGDDVDEILRETSMDAQRAEELKVRATSARDNAKNRLEEAESVRI